MTEEQKQQLAELIRAVAELQEWKDERERQQLDYPLDTVSETIIRNVQ